LMMPVEKLSGKIQESPIIGLKANSSLHQPQVCGMRSGRESAHQVRARASKYGFLKQFGLAPCFTPLPVFCDSLYIVLPSIRDLELSTTW
jgi:hypothetical protein